MKEQQSLFNEVSNDCGAEFSHDRNYRFSLWRIWDKSKPLVMFIGLNPSTANENEDDPTIRRVKNFAKDWGYGGFYMMNCWSLVSTDPKRLESCLLDEYDCSNIAHLKRYASSCEKIIFAWGSFDVVKSSGRELEMRKLFPKAEALLINKDGSPRHPLYVPGDTKPIPYSTGIPDFEDYLNGEANPFTGEWI